MTGNKWHIVLMIGALTLITAGWSPVAGADDFYKDKTIRLIVMTSPGGGYDTYARAIARFFGKHIPGNPSVIVQNMPGAGGFIATNYVYNVAKPDGRTILVTNSGVVLQQAVEMPGIRFDAQKFEWIGAPSKAIPVCAVMAFTGTKTLDEVVNSKKPLNFGAAGTSTFQQPMLLKLLLDANIKVVEGYSGTSGIRAAMQRREVDGACWQWTSMKVTARDMLDAKGEDRLIPFVIEGDTNDPEVKDVPQYTDVIKGTEKLAIFNAWMSQYRFYRPFLLPPKTPTARLNLLRKAFKDTLEDPAFRAAAKKAGLEIDYVSGEEATRYVQQTLAISPSVKDKLKPIVLR